MKLASFEAIAAALEKAGVRYLVAGGLAVAAHGHLRYTKDVDLVVQLLPDNIERAFLALEKLGYRPTVPIKSAQFANAGLRESWVRDKGMQVLQFCGFAPAEDGWGHLPEVRAGARPPALAARRGRVIFGTERDSAGR